MHEIFHHAQRRKSVHCIYKGLTRSMYKVALLDWHEVLSVSLVSQAVRVNRKMRRI